MIPLTRLSSTLAKRTGKAAPPYGRCYRAVLDGLIPAEKVGREWQIADADLATAERVLGLNTGTHGVGLLVPEAA